MAKCPLESAVSKDHCAVAGLSVGGQLKINDQNEKLVLDEGSWNDRPSGCFLSKDNDIVHYNTNPVGIRGNNYIPVCHEIEVRCHLWINTLYSLISWKKLKIHHFFLVDLLPSIFHRLR